MKILSASFLGLFLGLALLAAPAAAQAEYPSVMSGTVKIEMAAPRPTQTKPGDTLTIRVVMPPTPPAASDEDGPAAKLRHCGDRWNKKLAAYEKRWPKLKADLAYYNKWANYPAQRPPKPPEPLLTRESYRACIYACLGDASVSCPGGWPADTKPGTEGTPP